MNPFAVENFKPAEIGDGRLVREFLDRQEFYFCDYSFANLYCWGAIFDVRWQIASDRLWIYSFQRQRLFFPLGRDVGSTDLLAASDTLAASGLRGDIVFVESDFIEERPELAGHFEIEEQPDNADYVYLTQRLVSLSGGRLAKKKNLISQFRRLYPQYRATALAESDADRCLDLADSWCRIRACDQEGYRHENSALRRALEHFRPLGLEGVKIEIDGRMVAYALFSALNVQTADVHFEKSDPLVKGAGQAINWETARLCEGRFKYINREQDLGIPGLRQAKKSYEPACVLMPYFLRRR